MTNRIKTEHWARLRFDHGEDCEGCQDVALRKALHIVSLAGWRIVRTEDAGVYDPPEGWTFDPEEDDEDWDRSGVFYEDERRPAGSVPLVKISDEWTP
jgi:hypothetical protein